MACEFKIEISTRNWSNYRNELKRNCSKASLFDCSIGCSSAPCSSSNQCPTKCFKDYINTTLNNLQTYLKTKACVDDEKYDTKFQNCNLDKCSTDQKESGTFFIRGKGISCNELKQMLPDGVSVQTECKACTPSCCNSPIYCRLTLGKQITTPKTYSNSTTSTSISTSVQTSTPTRPPYVTSQTRFSTEVTSTAKSTEDFKSSVTVTRQSHTTDSSSRRAAALSQDKTDDSGAVTGGAIGGVGFLVVLAMILLYIFYFRRKSSRNEKTPNSSPAFNNTTYNQHQADVALGDFDASANDSSGYGEHYCSVQPETKEKFDYDYVVQSPPSTQLGNASDAVPTNYEFAVPLQEENYQNYFVLDPQNKSVGHANSAGDADKNYFTLEPDTQPIVNNADDNYFVLENNGRNVDSLDNKDRDGDDMYNTLNEGNKGSRDTGEDEYHHLRDVIKDGGEKDLDDYDQLHESKHGNHDEMEDDYDHCKPRRDDKYEDDYDHFG